MTSKTKYPDYIMEAARKAQGLSDVMAPYLDHKIMALPQETILKITATAYDIEGYVELAKELIENCGGSIVWRAVDPECRQCGDTKIEQSYFNGQGWRNGLCPYCTDSVRE